MIINLDKVKELLKINEVFGRNVTQVKEAINLIENICIQANVIIDSSLAIKALKLSTNENLTKEDSSFLCEINEQLS
jgi:hypothetical protein